MGDKMIVTDAILDLVMSFYADEPCRICGKNITRADLDTIVYAGYSDDGKARAAHKRCWDNRPPETQWVHR